MYEVGLTADRRLYYTMPVVRGRTLADVLERLRHGDADATKEYSLTRLVQLYCQVCHGRQPPTGVDTGPTRA